MQLDIARSRFDAGDSETAGRAAYLAAFHAAQALLFERAGKVFKTHRGVQSEFYRSTKDDPSLQPQLRAFLAHAYDLKTAADYEVDPSLVVSATVVEAACERAVQFVDYVEQLVAQPRET